MVQDDYKFPQKSKERSSKGSKDEEEKSAEKI